MNHNQDNKGKREPASRVKEFFAWLKGLWAPKYVPQRNRFGDHPGKIKFHDSDSHR